MHRIKISLLGKSGSMVDRLQACRGTDLRLANTSAGSAARARKERILSGGPVISFGLERWLGLRRVAWTDVCAMTVGGRRAGSSGGPPTSTKAPANRTGPARFCFEPHNYNWSGRQSAVSIPAPVQHPIGGTQTGEMRWTKAKPASSVRMARSMRQAHQQSPPPSTDAQCRRPKATQC